MPEIARSAQEKPTDIQVRNVNETPVYDYRGVPIDIIKFFDMDITEVDGKRREHLSTISKWAFNEVETLGHGMKRLRDLEIKLGSPRADQSRVDKIYNWVRFQEKIEDLKLRQEAVSG